MRIVETLYSGYLKLKNHVVKVEGNIENNTMGEKKYKRTSIDLQNTTQSTKD